MMKIEMMRRNEVEAAVSLSRSTIYKMMAEKRFPRAIRIGLRAVRWRRADVDDFLTDPNSWALRRNNARRRDGMEGVR